MHRAAWREDPLDRIAVTLDDLARHLPVSTLLLRHDRKRGNEDDGDNRRHAE